MVSLRNVHRYMTIVQNPPIVRHGELYLINEFKKDRLLYLIVLIYDTINPFNQLNIKNNTRAVLNHVLADTLRFGGI